MLSHPKKWIAGLLGVIAFPLSFLYVGQPLWALVYAGLFFVAFGFDIAFMARPYDAFGLIALIIIAIAMFHAIRFAARFPKDAVRPFYSRWYGMVWSRVGWDGYS